jgi:curli production assembly/transport component CsgF
MKKLVTLLLLGTAGVCAHSAQAQDFVYEPKNPAFGGGNTFNYSWLQASASAQNTTEEPAKPVVTADPLAQFAASLNQQVLSQLTSRLLSSQFGQGAIKPGSYSLGGYQVQVSQGTTSVVIQVTDTGSGNQTTVTIPKGL